MQVNPKASPFIKPAITIETPIIISNVIIIALSKVFFFISSLLLFAVKTKIILDVE